jgi:membrane-associated phospholipid phosphatase
MSAPKKPQPAGKPSTSPRQLLSKGERDTATCQQTATTSNANQPRYDMPQDPTPDELNPGFKNFAACFHKLLEHDPQTGLLTGKGVASYRNLLTGLDLGSAGCFNQGALNAIELAPPTDPWPRVLVNPQSSKALTLKGGDVIAYSFKKKLVARPEWELGYEVVYAQGKADRADLLEELSFASGYSAAEMVELYAMALLRDQDCDAYDGTHPDVQLALDALNAFGQEFRGPKEKRGRSYKVTAKTLFRGNSPEALRGDYLSKFLALKRPPLFASGCAPGTANSTNSQIFFEQLAEALMVPRSNARREFGLTWSDYVAIQNRTIPQTYQLGDFKGRVAISNGRHLATLVHVDSLYQEYAWAVDILTGMNYRRTPVSPYTAPRGKPGIYARNEGDGPTLGPPDAAGLVGAVALDAARLAWSQKYLVARRARPEVFGGLLHKRLEGGDAATYGPLDERLMKHPAVRALLERVKAVNGKRGGSQGATYLLSQVFPEASPAHPAWPSGHATVAGACVTVIKAIFDDTRPLLQQVPPVPPATEPPPYTDGKGQPLTVGGELDKLASNVALGRNFGGVHFRSDGEHGILLGEALALGFLQDHLRAYREKFRCNTSPQGADPCFELTKRSGERVRITASSIAGIAAPPAVRAAPTESLIQDRAIL